MLASRSGFSGSGQELGLLIWLLTVRIVNRFVSAFLLLGQFALQHACCWTLPQCDLLLSSLGQLASTGEAPVAIHAAADSLPIIHDQFSLDSYSSSVGVFLAVLMHSWP